MMSERDLGAYDDPACYTIAALFVEGTGAYADLFGEEGVIVDVWDRFRDARRYDGPHCVIAHPPCARWGRYWFGGPNAKERRALGDDGGCFESALRSVRRFGGVLEHPEGSQAWPHFGLVRPPRAGGWIQADDNGGMTCCVEQGHYGHRARKATWLYAHSNAPLPELAWGPSSATHRIDGNGFHTAEERARKKATAPKFRRMGARERAATPPAFRSILVGIATRAREVR